MSTLVERPEWPEIFISPKCECYDERSWSSAPNECGECPLAWDRYVHTSKLVALEAENATLKQERDKLLADVDGLTVDRDAAEAERDAVQELGVEDHKEHCRLMRDLEAECDRLRRAHRDIYENLSSLEDEGFAPKTRLTWTETMDILRSALSPSETEEGG